MKYVGLYGKSQSDPSNMLVVRNESTGDYICLLLFNNGHWWRCFYVDYSNRSSRDGHLYFYSARRDKPDLFDVYLAPGQNLTFPLKVGQDIELELREHLGG